MRVFGRRLDWQPWRWSSKTWAIVAFISVAIAPLVTRWICLWQVPDVQLPFDAEEFVSRTVPVDQNAFFGYVNVQKMLSRAETGWLSSSIKRAISINEEQDDPQLDFWLKQHQDLLLDFERATLMPLSIAEPVSKVNNSSRIPLHNEMPKLIELVQAEVARCERLGDFQRAWEWHLACLRCGRHVEMNGYAVAAGECRRIRLMTYNGIARWASYSDVSIAQLKQARHDLISDRSRKRLHSEILKFEYIMCRNSFALADWPDELYPGWSQSWPSIPVSQELSRSFLWTTGEPEVSLRLLRQVLVNQLQQVDKPVHQRLTPIRSEYPKVFRLGPTETLKHGQLSPESLARLLQGPIGQRLILAQWFSFLGKSAQSPFDLDHQLSSDQTQGDLIDIALASHEYQRTHGDFPEQLQGLVPAYLEREPIDELDSSRAPIRYRRQQPNVSIVWSVGHDGVDQGGRIGIDATEPQDRGYRMIILPRRKQAVNDPQ